MKLHMLLLAIVFVETFKKELQDSADITQLLTVVEWSNAQIQAS